MNTMGNNFMRMWCKENMIMKLHGSIEQRAVAAVVNERTRDDWLFGASGV